MRGLKPAAALAANKPHGVRLRYMAGCRCDECRRANSQYENERQKARRAGDWNGIVDAASARAHLLKLARAGVGRRAVQTATDIADSILFQIRDGTRKRIRARTERKILAVTPALRLDGALIPAKRTWKLINELIDEGYTKGGIAHRLGFKGYGIQLSRDRVTVRNAGKVDRLYRELTT